MIDGLYLYHRLRLACANGSAGVITCPLTKGSFIISLFVGRRYVSFNGYFRMGRNGKPGDGSFEYFEGLSPQSPDYVQLGFLPREFRHRGEEGERVLTESSDYWAALAFFPIFHANLPSLLPGTHPHAEHVRLVHLHPISSHVDKVAVGIGIDDDVTGADVATAVGLVAAQHGKFKQVHLCAGHEILGNWRVTHFFGRDRLGGTNFARSQPHQFQLALV